MCDRWILSYLAFRIFSYFLCNEVIRKWTKLFDSHYRNFIFQLFFLTFIEEIVVYFSGTKDYFFNAFWFDGIVSDHRLKRRARAYFFETRYNHGMSKQRLWCHYYLEQSIDNYLSFAYERSIIYLSR